VSALVGGFGRVADGDVEDETVEAGVADEQVAAAAKGEEFQAVLAGEMYGFEEFGLGCDLAEEAGWATDAEGGAGGEEDMLLDEDGGRWHGLEGTTTGRRTGASGAAGGETVQSKETAFGRLTVRG
jgi:hypothetical protein